MEEEWEGDPPTPPRRPRGRLAFDILFGVLPAVALLLVPLEQYDFSAAAGRMAYALLTGGAMAAWTFLAPRLRRSAAFYVGPLLSGAIAAVLLALYLSTRGFVFDRNPILVLPILLLAGAAAFTYGRAANDALQTAQIHRSGCLVLLLCMVGALMTFLVPVMVSALFRP